jgi:hypothetical protein
VHWARSSVTLKLLPQPGFPEVATEKFESHQSTGKQYYTDGNFSGKSLFLKH